MQELIWLNGETIPMSEARLPVEDRGSQFADGVYEVIRLYDAGKPFTLTEHLERLRKSATGIQIPMPLAPDALAAEIRKFIPKTGVAEGMVYLQLTRGVCPRNHLFPGPEQGGCKPTLYFYCRPLPNLPAPGEGPGAKLWSVPDERWKRCWIKSIALLANVLAKNEAVAKGADEAVFVDDGIVPECSASNLYAVIAGRVVTHPVGPKVLPGITRAVLLEVASELGIPMDERPLKEAEAMSADEVFITSTTREISWVGSWNGKTAGGGRCGPITKRLHEGIVDRVKRETARPAMAAAVA
jgi:D-alanine transaminase